jgi:ATP-dependent Clp protease ATP-binding subunit ClpC
VLAKLGIELDRARREVMALQDTESSNRSNRGSSERAKEGGSTNAQAKTQTLDEFGRDLTELARDGKLDPVVGRQQEIERVMQILSRRTKNNACLVGALCKATSRTC